MKIRVPEELMFIVNDHAQQKRSTESMSGKLCVVSGATSGVGYEAVKALAAGGANLVLIVRNEEKATHVKGELERKFGVNVDYFLADFSDLRQVEQVAHQIAARYKRIDVLINSAGIHSTRRILNTDGIELVFCVNHLAPLLLTQIVLDTLKASAPARIIQVNSEGHRFGGLRIDDVDWSKRLYSGLRSYGASKTAQLLTVWRLAKQLKGTGVTINAMHPGGVRTNIGNNNGWLYRWFLHHVTWHFLKEPKISGDALYYLASSKEVEQVSGKFFNLTIDEVPARHALDKDLERKIWDLSQEIIERSKRM